MVATPMQLNSPSFTIVISEKGGAERRELFTVAELSVGRVQGNDLLLPKGNVSKQHAKLFFRDGRFIVTDLNSTNGTYVNRRRIQQATVINEGDRIYIGDFVLRIESGEEPVVAGRTGEQSAAQSEDSTSNEIDAVKLSNQRSTDDDGASRSAEVPRNTSQGRLGTQPSWSDQSTGKLSLSAALSASNDRNGGLAGRTVRTEALSSSSSTSGISGKEVEASSLLGSLVDGILRAQRRTDTLGGETPDERDSIEQLLDERLAQLVNEGHVPAGAQAERLRLIARNELLDLGPLSRLLEDPAISDIIVPRFDQVLARKGGQIETSDLGFASHNSLERIIYRLCQRSACPVRPEESHIERRLAGGVLLCAVLPPLGIDGPSLVLRRPRTAVTTMQTIVRAGAISRAIASFFQQAVAARLRILVVGPRDAELGVITGALISTVVEGPLLILEGGEDLGSSSANVSTLRWSLLGSSDVPSIAKAAGRIATSHVVVALEESEMTASTIDLLGSGGTGAIVACPGRSIESVLSRLTLDVCAERPALSVDVARRLVAGAFDLVLEVIRYRDGRQRVVRLAEVGRVTSEEIEVDDVFTFVTTSGGSSDVVEGTFKGAGTVPRVVEELVARGVPFDTNLFGRSPSR
jgi:pilus assembly protein CpaF